MTTWHEHILAACRNDAERDAVWADYRAALADACAAGRAVAALEKFYAPSKPAVQAEVIGGGDTLAGRIRWLLENRGPLNAEQLTQLLGANPILVRRSCSDMSGTGAISMTKHPQGKRVFSVVNAIALVLLVALTGCSVLSGGRQSPGNYAPQDEPWMPVAAAAPITPELPTQNAQQQRSTMAEPRGLSVALAWDAVTWESFTVYASTNKADWRVVATTTNTTAVVTNIFLPQAFRVTARMGTDESDPSNVVNVIGQDSHIAVYAESAPDASGTNWTQYATVFRGTNVSEAMRLFRTRADSWTTYRTE